VTVLNRASGVTESRCTSDSSMSSVREVHVQAEAALIGEHRVSPVVTPNLRTTSQLHVFLAAERCESG